LSHFQLPYLLCLPSLSFFFLQVLLLVFWNPYLHSAPTLPILSTCSVFPHLPGWIHSSFLVYSAWRTVCNLSFWRPKKVSQSSCIPVFLVTCLACAMACQSLPHGSLAETETWDIHKKQVLFSTSIPPGPLFHLCYSHQLLASIKRRF